MESIENTIAVYRSHCEVEAAITAIKDSELDINHVALIGQDYPISDRMVLVMHEGYRPRLRTKIGEFWGSMRDLLNGSAIALIPEIGQVMVVGWLVDAFEELSVCGTRGVVTTALISIGVPSAHASEYESALKGGRFLLFVRGSAADLGRMQDTLAGTSATCVHTFRPQASAAPAVGRLSRTH